MKYGKRLDIISNISEKYVDEATEIRIRCVQRKGNMMNGALPTKYKILGAVAACLILCMGVVMVFQFLQPTPTPEPIVAEKSVPVYEGMTVSDTSGSDADGAVAAMHIGNRLMKPSVVKPGMNGNKPIGDAIKDSIEIVGGAEDIYYADKNSEIYITVHINNPDAFEILSFTLNGKKYTSYMFEENSDLENLVLKINTGDAQGIVDYTIDAIKYVDGTEIKDVKMEGDRTVKVGIRAETQPSAAVSNVALKVDSVSFDVTLADPMHVIGTEAGLLHAVLFDGEEIIKKQSLVMGENKVEFTELDSEKTYQYAIVAIYEAYDGLGYTRHILAEDTFTTCPDVMIDEESIIVNNDTVSFNIFAYNSISEVTLIELINSSGVTVDSITAEETVELVAPVGAYYTVKLTYTYTDGDETRTEYYTTEQFVVLNNRPLLDGLIADNSSQLQTLFTPKDDIRVYAVAGGTVSSVGESSVRITDANNKLHYYNNLTGVQVAEGDTVAYGDIIANGVYDDVSKKSDYSAQYIGPYLSYRGSCAATLGDEDYLNMLWWGLIIGGECRVADENRGEIIWRTYADSETVRSVSINLSGGAKYLAEATLEITSSDGLIAYYAPDEIDSSDPAWSVNAATYGAIKCGAYDADTSINLTVKLTYKSASIETVIPISIVIKE